MARLQEELCGEVTNAGAVGGSLRFPNPSVSGVAGMLEAVKQPKSKRYFHKEERQQRFEGVNLSIDHSDNPNALIRVLLFHMHSTIFQMRS
jgi:hypothetical protein